MLMTRRKERDSSDGQMGSFTQVSGRAIRSMEWECGFLQKAIVTWENGRKESWRAKGSINAKVGNDTKAASRTFSNMVGVNKSFRMETPMKELTAKVCPMEKVSTSGKT